MFAACNLLNDVNVQNSKQNNETTFQIGEKAIIKKNGVELYTFVINSVTKTDEQNQFEDSDPASVVVINYTYENLASEEDLYIGSLNFKVMDGQGNMCSTYPAANTYAQATPKGGKCTAAQAYGIMEGGGTMKLYFYDNLFNSNADAVFEFEVK